MDNKPKHIVFVIGNYKNGGVAQRATNLANEFEKGCIVIIVIEKCKRFKVIKL